jgi:predicted secreted protein
MPAFSAHGSSVTFDSVPVGGLTTISLPDQTKDEIEVTSHDSQGWREFVAGLRDGGRVTLAARLVPENAGQQALDANFDENGDVAREVVITTAPDRDSNVRIYTFQAYVSNTGGELPFDDAAEVNWELRITGLVEKNSI